jgi:phage shock protein A
MEMALDKVDVGAMKIEQDAEALRAAELVKQFKLEMGAESPALPAEGEFEKTIGKKSDVKA